MERRRSAERPHREAARGGGREARAALEAERSNDESAAEETFPRASAAARSAPSAAARSLTAAARREICGQGVCGGYQASRRFARSNRGAVKLRSASEKRPVNAMPPSACVSRRKPAFGAAAHRSQKIGGAKALLLIGGAEPEREERRGDTQTDAGTPFPERRDTAGGQTHPTAAHRKRLRAGTAMRECGNPLHPLEHANPGQGHLLQALALAAERYAERRSRNAGKAFRGPRGLGAPQLGQAKSRISAAHVPNSFRLRLGVPVLCRLGTVRPPGSANPRPSQRTFRKRRYSRFLPYTRTVRLTFFSSLNRQGRWRRLRMISSFHLLPMRATVVATGQAGISSLVIMAGSPPFAVLAAMVGVQSYSHYTSSPFSVKRAQKGDYLIKKCVLFSGIFLRYPTAMNQRARPVFPVHANQIPSGLSKPSMLTRRHPP